MLLIITVLENSIEQQVALQQTIVTLQQQEDSLKLLASKTFVVLDKNITTLSVHQHQAEVILVSFM